MSRFRIGVVRKTTEFDRHPIADRLLLENVQLDGATILDVGASSGATSVDLIRKLDESGVRVAAFYITDRDLDFVSVEVGRRTLFFLDGRCVMVAGEWLVAYPTESAIVRRLWGTTLRKATSRVESGEVVRLLGQAAARLVDERVEVFAEPHDVFRPFTSAQPDVIKAGNLLNFDYFSAEQLALGLETLAAALPDGGHLLIVENRTDGEHAGLYRRVGDRLKTVALGPIPPDIADLIERVEVPAD